LETVKKLESLFPNWDLHGHECLSWVWIDCKSEALAEECTKRCKLAGVPIRWGGLGYKRPTFIRLAVRSPHKQKVLFETLATLSGEKVLAAIEAVSAAGGTFTGGN